MDDLGVPPLMEASKWIIHGIQESGTSVDKLMEFLKGGTRRPVCSKLWDTGYEWAKWRFDGIEISS